MIEISAWYNVIFLIPLAVGLLMIFGSAFGAFGHGDVSHDIGHDLGHDVHHEVGHGQHGHEGKQGHAGALDLNADASHGFFPSALSFLGVGRVPFTVILMTMALLFGGTGMCTNYLIMPLLKQVPIMALVSLGAASVVMLILTGAIARVINRVMPSTESYDAPLDSLVGKTGKLIVQADGQTGFADVSDKYGNVQRISCRSPKETLPIGTQIFVVERREEDGTFVVEPYTA